MVLVTVMPPSHLTPRRARPALAALLMLVWPASACSPDSSPNPGQTTEADGGAVVSESTAPDGRAQGMAEASCRLTQVGRYPLELESGVQLFIEPRVLGSFGDAVLVAGQPIYEIEFGPGSRVDVRPTPAYFGAIVSEGSMAMIPRPPGVGWIGWVHGTRLGEERWGFVFEEVEGPGPEPEALRALYGAFSADGWEPVEELPAPEAGAGTARVVFGSSLRTDGEELVWATLQTDEIGLPVVTYRRDEGGWRAEVVTDPGAEAVELASRGGSTAMIVVGLAPELTHATRSIRFYETPFSNASTTRLYRRHPVEEILALETGASTQVAWLQRNPPEEGAWLLPDPWGEGADPGPIRLDPHAWMLRAGGVAADRALWATQSSDPLTQSSRMRFHESSTDGTVETLLDLPSPFRGPFSLTRSPTGEIVAVGPEAQMDATIPFVRSLVLRYSHSCDTATAADHLPGR